MRFKRQEPELTMLVINPTVDTRVPEPCAIGPHAPWAPGVTSEPEPTDTMERWAKGYSVPVFVPFELEQAANSFVRRRQAVKWNDDANGALADCCLPDGEGMRMQQEITDRRRIAVGLLRECRSIDEVTALTGLYRSEVSALAEIEKKKGRL